MLLYCEIAQTTISGSDVIKMSERLSFKMIALLDSL